MRPLEGTADGFDLRRFRVGQIYDVGTVLANLLLAEGWAIPIDIAEPALVVPLSTLNQKTVLIVDDDPHVRAMLNSVLAFAGFAVVEAGNGRDALAVLARERPSLIILDLKMPTMNGTEFREAQRRLTDSDLADIPVLVVSGADDAREVAQSLGAAGICEKPLDPDRILKAVQARIPQEARS